MRRVAIVLLAAVCLPASAQTPGLVPLTDLGAGSYRGFPGGLYPAGANVPPLEHLDAALRMAAQVVPRDAGGAPGAGGSIVMIAVGMSNTTHEFGAFERNEDANNGRNARLVLMDTAFGGQTASIIADPAATYWQTMMRRLAAMDLTAAQVQVAWLKEANAHPPDDFPLHAQVLRDDLRAIVQNLHDKFPNLKLCYLSSRIYGGYAAPGSLNPEPQAYESGFAVKWLIEEQIAGDPRLNEGSSPGPVRAPLLLWGPYLWANGPTPRSDGLVWLASDLEPDMTHPGPAGEQKVANLLASFFAGDETSTRWWQRRADAALVRVASPADAYTSAASPGQNFGAAATLLAQGGAQPMNVYVGVSTVAAPRPAERAKLSLRVSQSGGGRVCWSGNTAWGESAITWNNAPPIGTPVVELPQSTRDGTIAADVTAQVNLEEDGRMTFNLTTAAAGQASYSSRESGQPPVVVLTVSCAGGGPAGQPDTDGDGVVDVCDCAPFDATVRAAPGEIAALSWSDPRTLAWSSDAARSGPGTVYDVLSGDLATVALLHASPSDTCVADDLAGTEVVDDTPVPPAGSGRFYLVRGENVCGRGRYETATDGRDRLADACS